MDMDSEKGDSQKKDRGYAVLWGPNWLLKMPMPIRDGSRTGKKRRRVQAQRQLQERHDVQGTAGEESLTNISTKLITRYRPILHLDFLSDDELAVVERPLVDVLNTLPPAYFKHKYGT